MGFSVLGIFHTFLRNLFHLCYINLFALNIFSATISSGKAEGSKGKMGPLLVTNHFVP